MEPYLNRMSALANTQSGCGSSRKNLYQPNQTPITTTTAITPSHVMILRRRCATRCALSMDCSLQLIERPQRFEPNHNAKTEPQRQNRTTTQKRKERKRRKKIMLSNPNRAVSHRSFLRVCLCPFLRSLRIHFG